MSEEKKVRVSIGLYPSLLRLLDEKCERERRSRSNLIGRILERHFTEPEEEPASRSIPIARSVR